jgi:hypothetical protein
MENSEQNNQVGIITLKSVYSKDRKLIIQPAKDTRSGWYKGIKRLSDDEKRKLKYWVDPSTSLVITHNMDFNLSDPVDAMNWEWVKCVSGIAMSFEECQQSKEALFYADSQEVESLKAVSADKLIAKAMMYIFNDREDSLADKARLLGYDMSGENHVMIQETLLKIAKSPKTVHKVIDVYESTSVGIHLLFLKARDKNVIRHDNGAFLYGTSVLGVTEEAVLASMQDPVNRELVLAIEKELGSTEEAAKKKTTPVSTTSKNTYKGDSGISDTE